MVRCRGLTLENITVPPSCIAMTKTRIVVDPEAGKAKPYYGYTEYSDPFMPLPTGSTTWRIPHPMATVPSNTPWGRIFIQGWASVVVRPTGAFYLRKQPRFSWQDAPSTGTITWLGPHQKDHTCRRLPPLTRHLPRCPVRWWFQTCFIFHNIWDNPSHWLIFFKMVKTNQIINYMVNVFIW